MDAVKSQQSTEVETIVSRINSVVANSGFEVYPFKVGWYNESVATPFHLPHPYNCLAAVIISVPEMFEKGFIPFISKCDNLSSQRDPLDQYVASLDAQIASEFGELKLSFLHDYDIGFNKRPKVLMQTAGHVSGAAYYYQASQVSKPRWDADKTIYGVSLHPLFGGWFAFRSVVIFEDELIESFHQTYPKDVLLSDERKSDALIKFNTNWQDSTYRDVIDVNYKYSALQREYFSTVPRLRQSMLDKIIKSAE